MQLIRSVRVDNRRSAVRYDPMLSPDPVAWLALDEGERIAAVLRYHERAGAEAGSLRAHSAIHAAVETQLAEGRGTTLDALRRLLQEGLDRSKDPPAKPGALNGRPLKGARRQRQDTTWHHGLTPERLNDHLEAALFPAEPTRHRATRLTPPTTVPCPPERPNPGTVKLWESPRQSRGFPLRK